MKSWIKADICMHIDINKEIHDKELAHTIIYRDGQAQDLGASRELEDLMLG